MDTDPVCGMMVGRQNVADKSEYQGKTYYFCSSACKDRFDTNPLQYAVRHTNEG
jgi:YHS domain-containing protein